MQIFTIYTRSEYTDRSRGLACVQRKERLNFTLQKFSSYFKNSNRIKLSMLIQRWPILVFNDFMILFNGNARPKS